jgi:hypothetical protein
MMFFKKQPKVFCIGYNKTGTTSMQRALLDLGYKMGNQTRGEWLFDDWMIRRFSALDELVKSADAFQDAPFSFQHTFTYLDQRFPGSKFILTLRDSPEQWYRSIVSFHAKKWSKGEVPTKQELLEADYLYRGFPYKVVKNLFHAPDDDLYNKELLIDTYNRHNAMVIDYFRHRPKDLLVINLHENGSYHKMCDFLGRKPLYEQFPWENKT